ncbi:MAG: multidrug efflux RND transporter permease subunit [Candidatus Caenarcaniphilales bacterium]|nr:multidrug efflux RND transporter permease subunit [Candidatus Caenarcaniphilales bacterium]
MKNFVDFFIQRPIFAAVCSLVLVIGGLICIPSLPIAQYPEIAPPQITVTSTYTGANAEVVESSVTIPLEQEINGVEGAKYITSTSASNGISKITVTLDLERNADDAIVDIQNRIKRAEARLPDEVRRNGVIVEKTSTATILVCGLFSPKNTYDSYFVSFYSDRFVKEALKRIKGVSSVRIFGERKYSLRIWLDPSKLSARRLTAGEVAQALREQNIQVAAGQIGSTPQSDDQAYQMNVQLQSRLKSVEEFGEVILKRGDDQGELVKLKDVARIEIGAESYDTLLRVSGVPSVGMLLTQLPGTNALEVEREVLDELKSLRKDFPPDLEYAVFFNPTQAVRDSILEVVITLFEAIGLVVLVIFVFLQNWRTTLIPAVTIPVSLIGTFIFIKVFDFSINTLTLFGLTLATGLVVDDAIIVIENIERFIREKKLNPREASSQAMSEVIGPVIASALVLVAVFVPVAFFPGTTGRIYKQFALTIAFSISLSAFIALTLTPAMSALLIESDHEAARKFRIFQLFNDALTWLRNNFRNLLGKALKAQNLMLGVFGICLVGMVFLYRVVPSGFIPSEDVGYFFVIFQTPEGTSLSSTSKTMQRVEKMLVNEKDIQIVNAVPGFSFLGSGANKGIIFAVLKPIEERKDKAKQSVTAIINRLRGPLMGIDGAIVLPFEPPPVRGLSNFGGFSFEVLATGTQITIPQLAQNTYALMGAANQTKEMQGVFTSFTANDPQVNIDLNRNLAKTLGIPLTDIFDTLQIFLGSLYVNDFDCLNRVYRVYVQADIPFRSEPKDILSYEVRTQSGEMLPLQSLVKIKESVAPQSISHYNLFRSTELNGSPAIGYSTGQAIQSMEKLAGQVLPKGFSFDWTGTALEEKDAGASSLILFGMGFVFVFLFLAAQYESLIDPLIILLAVPLAILGALSAQLIAGLQNDVFCQIGLVMLIGLASKNAILIVEFANQLRERGSSILKAIYQATLIRFRPILMTSFAFILGVVPLVIAQGSGAASRNSLGTAIFGGMIVSTLLSLFIVPVLYVLIKTIEENITKTISKKTMSK